MNTVQQNAETPSFEDELTRLFSQDTEGTNEPQTGRASQDTSQELKDSSEHDVPSPQHEDAPKDQQEEPSGNSSHDKEAQKPDEDAVPKWQQHRIARWTRQTRDAQRRAQAAEEEAENLRRALAHARGEDIPPSHGKEYEAAPSSPDNTPQPPHTLSPQEMEQHADFTRRCNDLAASYTEKYGQDSLTKAMSDLTDKAGLDGERPDHLELLSDMLDLPNADDVFHALAHAPNEASDIFNAPPRRQYALLDRFVQNMAKSQTTHQVSKAPRPVSDVPISGRAPSSRGLYDQNISTKDFAAQFEKAMNTR